MGFTIHTNAREWRPQGSAGSENALQRELPFKSLPERGFKTAQKTPQPDVVFNDDRLKWMLKGPASSSAVPQSSLVKVGSTPLVRLFSPTEPCEKLRACLEIRGPLRASRCCPWLFHQAPTPPVSLPSRPGALRAAFILNPKLWLCLDNLQSF